MTRSDTHATAVDHLSTRRGDPRAVDDVPFAVHAGDALVLPGPDGAGGSTTVAMIETIPRPMPGPLTRLTLQSAGVLAASAAAASLAGAVLTRRGA